MDSVQMVRLCEDDLTCSSEKPGPMKSSPFVEMQHLHLLTQHPLWLGFFYDTREVTSRLILSPIDLSATSRSCSDCKPIQNAAEVPKNFARRNAVSADKLLLRFVISVSREGGMPVERDTDARLSPIGLMNSSSKISPG